MVRKILTIAVLAPLVVACAPLAAFSAPALNPDQVSLVQSACDQVMGMKSGGLTPGSGAFGQCVASLDADLFNPD